MLAQPSQPSQPRKGRLMTVKEQIDIEALLYRAYAQHRIDRAVGRDGSQALWSMLGLSFPVMATANYGERVDTSLHGALVAARMGHAEAAAGDPLLALHDRVLALGDMWFAWRGEEVVVWDRHNAAEAGCEIVQAAGAWWLEQAGRPIERMQQAGVMALVIQHARAGTRPDVHLDWRAAPGRRAASGSQADGWGRRRRTVALSQQDVQQARALYHAWRCALVLLQAECEGLLPGLMVTGPAAEAAPWLAVIDEMA